MSSIHQDKWFMWLDTNCNLPENFKATTICNSPLENTGLFYADNSLKRTSRVPPSIYAKPHSGIWKSSACGFGLKYSPLGMQNPPAFEIWNPLPGLRNPIQRWIYNEKFGARRGYIFAIYWTGVGKWSKCSIMQPLQLSHDRFVIDKKGCHGMTR